MVVSARSHSRSRPSVPILRRVRVLRRVLRDLSARPRRVWVAEERADRWHRARPIDPGRQGLIIQRAAVSHYPAADDVTALPTLDEQVEQVEGLTRPSCRTLPRSPGHTITAKRRDRRRQRWCARRSPDGTTPAYFKRRERRRSTQGRLPTTRRPARALSLPVKDDPGSAPAWSPVISFWAADFSLYPPIAAPRRTGFLATAMSMFLKPVRPSGRSHDHGDL